MLKNRHALVSKILAYTLKSTIYTIAANNGKDEYFFQNSKFN